jgi:hypothetical protein
VGRFLAGVLVCAALVGCQNETHPVVSPAPSPTPHVEPTAAILQSSDVPAGLAVCLGSGPMDVYLSMLEGADPVVGDRVTKEWLQLVTVGADAGAMSVFAASPGACNAELGATTNLKAMASFVARFGDESQADRAFQAGIFGFMPPPPGQLTPGVTVGTSTGLGVSSFTYERPSVRLACWRHGVYVALVAVSNLDLTTFKAATAAIDPRLN